MLWLQGVPSGNTCSLVYPNSGYCQIRPASYLGGALSISAIRDLNVPEGTSPMAHSPTSLPPILARASAFLPHLA